MLWDFQSLESLTMLNRLPIQILNKSKGVVSRGICKITWTFCNDMSRLKQIILCIKIKNGTKKLDAFLCGSEFAETSGLSLIKKIKHYGKNLKSKNRPRKYPILLLSLFRYPSLSNKSFIPKPFGSHKLFLLPKNSTKPLVQTFSNKKNRYLTCNSKKLYFFAKLTFEKLAYEEYLECHELLRDKANRLIFK
jgi:hypothetical protein